MSVPVDSIHGRARYVVIFIDEFTGVAFPYLMRSKGEVLSCLIRFHSDVALANGMEIGRLHSDNGREFKNKRLQRWLAQHQIARSYSPSYTPELNGRAERSFRTLMNDVRAMLRQANLPVSFWGLAFLHAAAVRNMVAKDGEVAASWGTWAPLRLRRL